MNEHVPNNTFELGPACAGQYALHVPGQLWLPYLVTPPLAAHITDRCRQAEKTIRKGTN
jgi:hypothetical protein